MFKDNKKINKFKIRFLLFCFSMFIIGFLIDQDPFCSKTKTFNEKATIEYLKKFAEGDISKIVILTQGNYSKFQAGC